PLGRAHADGGGRDAAANGDRRGAGEALRRRAPGLAADQPGGRTQPDQARDGAAQDEREPRLELAALLAEVLDGLGQALALGGELLADLFDRAASHRRSGAAPRSCAAPPRAPAP